MTKTKKVPVIFESKWDLACAIHEGRKLSIDDRKLHYIDNGKCFDPFRLGEESLYLVWETYNTGDIKEEVEIPWYDDIPEEGILCWVSSKDEDAKVTIKVIMAHFHTPDEFRDVEYNHWKYATPVKPAECYQGD